MKDAGYWRPLSRGDADRVVTPSELHPLSIAGHSDTIFSDEALGIVHQVSRSLPRLVNNLACSSS